MPSAGDKITHYEILRPLGKGGMGEVFLAHDAVLDRKVALKFLVESAERDATARGRFLREAKAAAALDHPFICKVYEIGEVAGRSFIAMEYVEGETLEDRIEKEPLSLSQSLQIAGEIADALEFAHQSGIVHRDLKLANIMLTTQGHVKVMDFGLAKAFTPPVDVDSEAETLSGMLSGKLTQAGHVVGTLAFMSPEQARGEQVDQRSDIFSFGLLFYEMLAGKHPFRRRSALDTVSAILRDPLPPLRLKDTRTPPELESILRRATAKEREQRYASVRDLAVDLQHVRESTAKRVMRWPLIAAGPALVVLLLAGTWWVARRASPTSPPVPQEAVMVLIADFQNQTGDPIFDGALEQTLAISLEDASFITTYNRFEAQEIARQLNEDAATLDGSLARLVALREGIDAVVEGSIAALDAGYEVSINAVDPTTGEPIVTEEVEAGSRSDVLAAIGELAMRTREALGEAQPRTSETFTAASIEAAQEYALGLELQDAGKWREAIPHYLEAVRLDPGLGRAYGGLAVSHRNLGQSEEAEKYYQQAMEQIDRMTDREKYRTRGGYYLTVRDYPRAIDEYRALVEQYPADFRGHANLAVSYFFVRDMARALEEQSLALEIFPNNAVIKGNLAAFAMYAGEYETAVREASAVVGETPSYELAYCYLALAQLGMDRSTDAADTYRKLATVSSWGASAAAMGLGDLALYEGRLNDAVAILQEGVTGDLAGDNASAAARKMVMLADAQLTLGQAEQALATAERAVDLSQEEPVAFTAARVFLGAGREDKALELASALGNQLQVPPRVYAKLLEGEVQVRRGQVQEAVTLFREAQKLADTWLGHLALGKAYLEAKAFTEAHSEFELCLKRRGEATSVFVDDLPTYAYLPPVYYYLGRAQEGLKSAAAVDSYRTFLSIKKEGDEDPRVVDARRRLVSY